MDETQHEMLSKTHSIKWVSREGTKNIGKIMVSKCYDSPKANVLS
jgi:hypothetical protein